jgi:hypothetical protein
MHESDFDSVDACIRSLDDIRDDIVEAVTALGTGFARHPDNSVTGENIDPQAMKRALLRLVYQLLFWFIAEERDLLHPQDTDEQTRRRYRRDYSAHRLRQASRDGPDSAPGGLWQSVRLVLDGLGGESGLPHLGLSGLGGIFGESDDDQVLRGLSLSDEYLLAAVQSLCSVRYPDLEDLDVIGQSLLEFAPGWSESGWAFTLTAASGGQRASTGAHYVPTALVDCLLGTALDPVLDAASESRQAEQALLSVTVCDPACGSGRFLVAAARRIANRVAAAREHTPAPSAEALRQALRDVVENCVYGVDLSDMAVELAKVCLWLESAEPGKALSFLDDHVKQGNSLIGAVPGLTDNGIPDSAFKPVEGDDPKFARSLLRANAKPSPGQFTLFSDQTIDTQSNEILVADAWCAAFTWTKRPDEPRPIVNRALSDLREQGPIGILPDTLAEIERLREEYRFFHWHLEFPGIFGQGGFSCVVTNPPWDTVDPQEVKATFGFARSSGAYPECAKGLTARGITTLRADHLFTERLATITAPTGRAGCVVPTGIAISPGGQNLLGSLVRRGVLASLYDFEKRGTRFCLLTLTGRGSRVDAAKYAFFLRDPAELEEDDRVFTLTADEIALINPNTGSLPAFRSRKDATLTTSVYRRMPVLWDETRDGGNPWKMRLAPNFFRTRDDSGLFRTQEALRDEGWDLAGTVFTRDSERMLPVYESAMVRHFDHQHGQPRYWVAEHGPVSALRRGKEVDRPGVAERLKALGWTWGWLCGWRETGQPEDERTAIPAFLPRTAVTESFPLMLPRAVPPFVAALIAAQSSLVFDFVCRQKLGGTRMRPAAWKQLPVPTPEMLEPHLPFVVPRVLELVYTDDDMAPLARDLDDDGDPFVWDSDRRAELRAELDAFFFRLYGIDDRDDVDYILGTFQTAKHLVLDAYDRMAATDAGSVYETRIVPFPGHGARAARL